MGQTTYIFGAWYPSDRENSTIILMDLPGKLWCASLCVSLVRRSSFCVWCDDHLKWSTECLRQTVDTIRLADSGAGRAHSCSQTTVAVSIASTGRRTDGELGRRDYYVRRAKSEYKNSAVTSADDVPGQRQRAGGGGHKTGVTAWTKNLKRTEHKMKLGTRNC